MRARARQVQFIISSLSLAGVNTNQELPSFSLQFDFEEPKETPGNYPRKEITDEEVEDFMKHQQNGKETFSSKEVYRVYTVAVSFKGMW